MQEIVWRQLAAPLVAAFLAAACSPRFQPIPEPVNAQHESTVARSSVGIVSADSAADTALDSEPTSLPPAPPSAPTPLLAQEEENAPNRAPVAEAAMEIGGFAEMQDNLATGELAPDFEIRTLGNSTFVLSDQRGAYVLLVPTAIGCGECVFTMNQLAAAYPSYRSEQLKLVLINMYPKDVPESWEAYSNAYPDLGATWGVVSSVDFVANYDIRSLGTILLVDPSGKLVFRSDHPLLEQELRQLFELASR